MCFKKQKIREMNQESDHPLLPEIASNPARLKELAEPQLAQVAREIRELLCRLSEKRSVHFASNLGVVELAVALHSSLDFSKDRLVWDTGHPYRPLQRNRVDPDARRADGISESR